MKYGGFRSTGAISLGQTWTESLPDVEDINYQRVFLGCVCVCFKQHVLNTVQILWPTQKKSTWQKKVQPIGILY